MSRFVKLVYCVCYVLVGAQEAHCYSSTSVKAHRR